MKALLVKMTETILSDVSWRSERSPSQPLPKRKCRRVRRAIRGHRIAEQLLAAVEPP